MPQFDTSFYPAQIFWMLISFGFLYLMISQLICPMIEEVLLKRANKIKYTLEQAEAFNQEAVFLNQKYQTFLQKVETEKNEKTKKAYQDIQAKMKALEQKSESNLKRQIRKSEKNIEKATFVLQKESNDLSSELAELLVCQIEKEVEGI